MSDSRLEKFIYAICSMDVSDLPVPLSRIEKLWNCLITGETPDFEPLSRNEKYLMAMLDRYDISNLPAPMSRGEKLLYKIAVGETDLSDVPGYLSRYEELLKYLIENGGISEGDFEYILYTLNQSLYTLYTTAEKPVKSAILKGRSLVNLSVSSGYKTVTFTPTQTYIPDFQHNVERYKPNTKYLVITEFNHDCKYKFGVNVYDTKSIFNETTYIQEGVGKVYKHILTTKSDFTGCNTALRTVVYNNTEETDFSQTYRMMIIEYQDGMENWNIPYFEGMQSVKMPVLKTTGKNLFDGLSYIDGFIAQGNNYTVSSDNDVTSILVNVNKNTDYILSAKTNFSRSIVGGSLTPISIGTKTTNLNSERIGNTIKFNSGIYTNIIIYLNETKINIEDIQVEEGSTATTYEPFKSNILSTSEDVILRGIGDVRDTLDLISGEIIEIIGEGVLNGSEAWLFNAPKEQPNHWCFHNDQKLAGEKLLISDRFPQSDIDGDRESIRGGENFIFVYISKEKVEGNVNSFNQWLSQNPIKYQYRKSEKSVKTVDLTTVDQDNQPTELGTFENVTHVSLVAENLIPEVEMEVATHISTELASASPLMDDILTNQQQLETTVDEQSNNVDATMIATTEIYEETL